MSIIEKALERLEQSDIRTISGTRGPATATSNFPRDASDDGLIGSAWEATESLAPLAPTPLRTSQTVMLDLKALEKLGYLTPATMHLPRADEYRRIKRPVLVTAFSDAAKKVKNANLVAVTSSVEGEGKSYTSLNLAMSVATELDRTVLLVDTDVFKQSLTKTLNLTEHPGLTDFLRTEGADLADYLLRTNVPNLAFIPAGRLDYQIAELWGSGKMQQFMDELARRYPDRLVIFDTPPVLAHASTMVLTGMVGQVLLVVEAERTDQHLVTESLRVIGENVRVGLILNKTNQRESADYGYGYYSQ
jgi:exopolysaccharide/PEP-CTERM locus tyrosine autokinase